MRRSFFYLLGMITVLGSISCASVGSPGLQPEINGLLVSGRAALAARKITAEEADYGSGNYVLYHLDRALVLQLSADYARSIRSLEKAKARHEELYTRSVSKQAMTWVVNDNIAPYYAPEYERVLMNIFQAFNYLYLGDAGEALVEARDLDSKFPAGVSADAQKKRFEDDGFARLFFGILYESSGDKSGRNDALIAYQQSLAVYDAYYDGKYVPRILQEGLIRLAAEFGDEKLSSYRARFPGIPVSTHRDDKAVVYFFEAVGFSPIKVPEIIPVPVDRGFILKLAFPRFIRRVFDTKTSRLSLTDEPGHAVSVETELGMDIEALAERDLEARKAWVLSKSVIRPALKYLIERNQKEIVRKKYGDTSAEVFGILGNLYNFYTEQADLRSWQALPAQVRLARIQVDPGNYSLRIEDMDETGAVLSGEDKGCVALKAGQVYFVVRRSVR